MAILQSSPAFETRIYDRVNLFSGQYKVASAIFRDVNWSR